MTRSRGARRALVLLICCALGFAGCSSSKPECAAEVDCGAGQICDCGACKVAPTCAAGERLCSPPDGGCSPGCVDVTTNQNCGACGAACDAGQSCVALLCQ